MLPPGRKRRYPGRKTDGQWRIQIALEVISVWMTLILMISALMYSLQLSPGNFPPPLTAREDMKTRNVPLQYLHAGYLSHNREECQCPARRGGAAGRHCKSAIIKVLSKRLADGRERTTAKANFAAVLFLCFSLISGADNEAQKTEINPIS